MKMVAFVDDVFTLHRRWTLDFAEIYGKRCGLPFSVNTRFDNVDEEIVSSLATAGLTLVYAGVEGGNEWVRNTLMKRQMTVESMIVTVGTGREAIETQPQGNDLNDTPGFRLFVLSSVNLPDQVVNLCRPIAAGRNHLAKQSEY